MHKKLTAWMRERGLSYRDMGQLLGISHQSFGEGTSPVSVESYEGSSRRPPEAPQDAPGAAISLYLALRAPHVGDRVPLEIPLGEAIHG
jgi:hypothetical protein